MILVLVCFIFGSFEIRENSEPEQWHHVSGVKNPADDITRGLDTLKIGPASRWVNGPEFLR